MVTPRQKDERNDSDIARAPSDVADLSSMSGPSLGGINPFSAATVAPLVHQFLNHCGSELLDQSTKELPVSVKNGDWSPYEIALGGRLMGVAINLSRRIVSQLISSTSAPTQDDIALNLRWGGFQVHTDTNLCFWIGIPSSRGDFEQMIRESIDTVRPFESEALRQFLANIIQSSVYTGTSFLPGFNYAAITPDFLTLRYDAKA